MKSKKIVLLSLVSLFLLSACQYFDKKEVKPNENQAVKQIKAVDEEQRLKFNQIKLGRLASEFKGGSTIEEMIQLFGQPTTQEKIPAGENIELDSLTWQFEQASLSIRFFENSAISRSISNFEFIRDGRISLDDFEALEDEESYKTIIDRFGQPDVIAESISSESEHIQAIWTSNLLYDKNNPFIELTFENNILVKKVQNGLKKSE